MTRSVRREFVALLCALSHDLATSRARFPRIRDAAAVQDLEGELSYWLEGDSAADTSAASDAAEALVLARSALAKYIASVPEAEIAAAANGAATLAKDCAAAALDTATPERRRQCASGIPKFDSELRW